MQSYIALLRGINVSGKNIIKMAELKNMFQQMNFDNVETYIQSGNVVFCAQENSIEKLVKNIIENISKTFKLTVPCQVFLLDDFTQIRDENPFIKSEKYDTSFLHVTLLNAPPETSKVIAIKQEDFNDEFVITNNAVYLYCSNGYGQTKLTNTFFENKFKVQATTRNWKTINQLINIASNKL